MEMKNVKMLSGREECILCWINLNLGKPLPPDMLCIMDLPLFLMLSPWPSWSSTHSTSWILILLGWELTDPAVLEHSVAEHLIRLCLNGLEFSLAWLLLSRLLSISNASYFVLDCQDCLGGISSYMQISYRSDINIFVHFFVRLNCTSRCDVYLMLAK